jgi:hypothetical protein
VLFFNFWVIFVQIAHKWSRVGSPTCSAASSATPDQSSKNGSTHNATSFPPGQVTLHPCQKLYCSRLAFLPSFHRHVVRQAPMPCNTVRRHLNSMQSVAFHHEDLPLIVRCTNTTSRIQDCCQVITSTYFKPQTRPSD